MLGTFEAAIHHFELEFKSNPKDIIAVLLPSVSVEYFEVGTECAEQFEQAGHVNSLTIQHMIGLMFIFQKSIENCC